VTHEMVPFPMTYSDLQRSRHSYSKCYINRK